jgi:hypothetical protein
MADYVSISGGATKSPVRPFSPEHKAGLTPHEYQTALQALQKLKTTGGVSQGVASVLGGALKDAPLTIRTGLIGSQSHESFAGGVKSDVKASIRAIGSDTVVAGSAFTKTELTGKVAGVSALSSDTIKAAGVTAASVKTDPTEAGKSAAHTITMSDKTSITLSGISTHDVIKPH